MTGSRGEVLVVDDKATMLSLVTKILGDQHAVTTAADGLRALALIETRPFDVVLTDVRMPGADGFAIVRVVKQRWPATEVIMMTGFASIAAAVDAIKAGAYDYLQKPFDPDEVSLVVARALARKRATDGTDGAGAELASLSYKAAINLARDEVSRDYLTALLRRFRGNVTQAAERAGIERESLHRLLKRYGLRAESFRAG